MGSHLMPAGAVSGKRSGNGTVDNTALQRARYFTVVQRDSFSAECLQKLCGRAATGANLLAFQVKKPIDLGITEHYLGRVSNNG